MKLRLNNRLIITLISILIVGVYGILMITGYSATAKPPVDYNDKNGKGYLIIREMLQRLGYSPVVWNGEKKIDTPSLILFLPKDSLDSEQKLHFTDRLLSQGNTLFYLGIPDDEYHITRKEVIPISPAPKDILWTPSPTLEEVPGSIEFIGTRTFPPDNKALLGSDNGSLIIERDIAAGKIILVADPRLFANRNMKNEDTAALANSIMRNSFGQSVYLYLPRKEEDVSGPVNPVMILFRGKALPVMIHLLFFGSLVAAAVGIRFGKPLVKNPRIRRSLSHHLGGIGSFYQKTKAVHLAYSIEHTYFLTRLADLFGLHEARTGEDFLKAVEIKDKDLFRRIEALLKDTKPDQKKLLQFRKEADQILNDIENKEGKT